MTGTRKESFVPFQYLTFGLDDEDGSQEPAILPAEPEDSETLTGIVGALTHNCVVHPLMGTITFAGHVLRALSPRTRAVGFYLVALGQAIHDL